VSSRAKIIFRHINLIESCVIGGWLRDADHIAGQDGRGKGLGRRFPEEIQKLRVLAEQHDRPQCRVGRTEV